jgi:hypothetical protein
VSHPLSGSRIFGAPVRVCRAIGASGTTIASTWHRGRCSLIDPLLHSGGVEGEYILLTFHLIWMPLNPATGPQTQTSAAIYLCECLSSKIATAQFHNPMLGVHKKRNKRRKSPVSRRLVPEGRDADSRLQGTTASPYFMLVDYIAGG